jgi:hypothetical protein
MDSLVFGWLKEMDALSITKTRYITCDGQG